MNNVVDDNQIEELAQKISQLSLMDAAKLASRLGEVLGIDLNSVSAVSSGQSSAGDAPEAEEKSEFKVFIKEFDPAKKIGIIKVVREMVPGLGLKEAKEFVESCPKELEGTYKKDVAESHKKKLEEAGAKVELQ